jgi:hypothetical protein
LHFEDGILLSREQFEEKQGVNSFQKGPSVIVSLTSIPAPAEYPPLHDRITFATNPKAPQDHPLAFG